MAFPSRSEDLPGRVSPGRATLRAAAGKMNDQGDGRDDQDNVDQASRDVEGEPAENPHGNKDNEQNQEQRKEHGVLLFRPLRPTPRSIGWVTVYVILKPIIPPGFR